MAKTRTRRAARTRRQAAARPATPTTPNDTPGSVDLSALREPLDTIAKSFAMVALRLAPERRKTMQDRALFLKGLGLQAAEIAALLGSTPGSIGELISRSRRK